MYVCLTIRSLKLPWDEFDKTSFNFFLASCHLYCQNLTSLISILIFQDAKQNKNYNYHTSRAQPTANQTL